MKYLIITAFMIASFASKAQDSLTIDVLEELTYRFTINNGEIIGDGKDFFNKKISDSQFTMLGEYHGSHQISKLTEALIPVLSEEGYSTFIAEIGPYSAQVLSELASNQESLRSDLKELQDKYSCMGDMFTAIPFFSNKVDADFLQKIAESNWQIVGIDQEFIFGTKMLFDHMYNEIPTSEREVYSEQYKQVVDTLERFFVLQEEDNGQLDLLVKNSSFLHSYCKAIQKFGQNKFIQEKLYKSIEIYSLNRTRMWYESNEMRIRHMKNNLREELAKTNFDLSSEKAFVKMGGYHTSKGFSPLGFYEVGNMLNEIAEYNGNSAFNFTFANRFYIDEGEEIDELDSEKQDRLIHFIRMGKRDEWTIIDLKPIIKGVEFYPVKYKITEAEKRLIQQYDALIIPPLDWDAEKL